MLAFIKYQPAVVEPSCDISKRHVDLVRIIQPDEVPGGAEVVEICSYMQHSVWQLTQYHNSVAFIG